MTFTVEISNPDKVMESRHVVEIYMDKELLADMIFALKKLQAKDPGDHLHFFSESWGGDDLTEEVVFNELNKITHHLKITLVE